MKLALKSMVSSLLAVAVLAVSSVTAFAVDYQDDPDYPKPDVDSYADGTSDVGKSADKPADVVTEDYISSYDGDTVEVYVNEGRAILTAEAVSEVSKANKPIVMIADGYTVTLDPADIILTEPRNINLAMIDEKLSDDSVKITPVTKGDFGMRVTVGLPADTMKGLDAETTQFFYVADDGSKTELASDITYAGEDAKVRISHASYYVIVDKDSTIGDSETSVPDTSSDDVSGNDDSGDVPPTGVTLVVVPAAIAGAALAASAIVIKRKNK